DVHRRIRFYTLKILMIPVPELLPSAKKSDIAPLTVIADKLGASHRPSHQESMVNVFIVVALVYAMKLFEELGAVVLIRRGWHLAFMLPITCCSHTRSKDKQTEQNGNQPCSHACDPVHLISHKRHRMPKSFCAFCAFCG